MNHIGTKGVQLLLPMIERRKNIKAFRLTHRIDRATAKAFHGMMMDRNIKKKKVRLWLMISAWVLSFLFPKYVQISILERYGMKACKQCSLSPLTKYAAMAGCGTQEVRNSSYRSRTLGCRCRWRRIFYTQ